MSPILSYLGESGKSFSKNSSQRYISPWNTVELYRLVLDGKRTLHEI